MNYEGILQDSAVKAAAKSTREYTKFISESIESLKNKTLEYSQNFKNQSNEIEKIKNNIIEKFDNINNLHQEISELRNRYFYGNENEIAIEARVNTLLSSINDLYDQISEYHRKLLDNGSDSIANQINVASESSQSSAEEISVLLSETERQLKELKSFHLRVVGKEDVDGKLVGGLQEELNNRQLALDNFKREQELRYKTLNEQIENLLPGATSAGLATAYRAMRKSFSEPIKRGCNRFCVTAI